MIVVWRVTESCNLSCPFCAYDRTLDRPRRSADLTAVRGFGAVLADYQRATGDRVLVSWLGGEPFLWPELRGLADYFHRDLGLRLSTTTNGTTLRSPAMRAHVLAHYDELTVSVDAPGAEHDRLRGWPGAFAALRAGVCKLRAERESRRPLLRANVVLMRETIGDFPALCEELATWGFDEITFNQLGGNDRPEFFATHRLLPGQVARFTAELPDLRVRLTRLGVSLASGDAYLRRLAASTRGERIAIADCRPGERFLFVDERGFAAPCSFTVATCGVPLAEISSWADLRELPRRFAGLRSRHAPEACGDCHSTQVFAKFAA